MAGRGSAPAPQAPAAPPTALLEACHQHQGANSPGPAPHPASNTSPKASAKARRAQGHGRGPTHSLEQLHTDAGATLAPWLGRGGGFPRPGGHRPATPWTPTGRLPQGSCPAQRGPRLRATYASRPQGRQGQSLTLWPSEPPKHLPDTRGSHVRGAPPPVPAKGLCEEGGPGQDEGCPRTPGLGL